MPWMSAGCGRITFQLHHRFVMSQLQFRSPVDEGKIAVKVNKACCTGEDFCFDAHTGLHLWSTDMGFSMADANVDI